MKTRVYTKTGDDGTTSLIGGERVYKNDVRVEAYGTVDELSAHLALLGDMMREAGSEAVGEGDGVAGGFSGGFFGETVERIGDVQCDLMTVEAMLATGNGGENRVKPLPESAVKRLEDEIDAISAGLPPVEGFTIPGGHTIVSWCHVCRTVCRRAERVVVEASGQYDLSPMPSRYLNRLSDWLYVVGRKAIEELGVKEIYWKQ